MNSRKSRNSFDGSLESMLRLQQEQQFSNPGNEMPSHLSEEHFQGLPGRLVYLVNCKTSNIEWVKGDVSRIFNRTAGDYKQLSDFYEEISRKDVHKVVEFTTAAMKWTFAHVEQLKPFGNRVRASFRIMRKHRPVSVIRNNYIANKDRNGAVTHALGIIELNDFSKLINMTGDINGPLSQTFENPEIRNFENILSVSEIAVLREVAMGLRNSQIADKLHLSVHTVETHRKNMIRKLEARNTPNLIYLAHQMGLL